MSAESLEQQRCIGFEMFASRALHVDLFQGVTDPERRKTYLRTTLKAFKLESAVLDDLQGWETWACRFERIYGEAL